MRGFGLVLLALVAATAVGCGGGADEEAGLTVSAHTESGPSAPPSKKVLVHVHETEGPDDLGVLMADKQGYFEEAGLDVRLAPPVGPIRSMKAVASGEDDFGIVQLPQVAIAKEEGLPIIAVGSVLPLSTVTIIWRKGLGVREVAGLKGKTIGVPRIPYLERFLQTVIARKGLSHQGVQIEPLDSGLVPALLNRRVDAIFGASLNKERVELEARNMKLKIKPARVLGIPPYEEFVVVSRPATVANDPRLVHDFMAAAVKGADAALQRHRVSTNLIAKTESPRLDRAVAETEAEATGLVLSRTGHMDPALARELLGWMYDQGLISEKLPVKALMTNSLG